MITPAEPDDDDFLPLSALNDVLFCERRAALHRSEQVWVDNVYTLEGTAGHKKVHADPSRQELGTAGRVVRGMWLKSLRLRLVGVADLVEFRPLETGPVAPGAEPRAVPYPVEFKRGRRRRWNNDDAQLCAQALCLEEMLNVVVPAGAIFHLKSRRRREVRFDEPLRQLTIRAAARLHELVDSGETPPPVLKPRCAGCSLQDLCMPRTLADGRRAMAYVAGLYRVAPDSDHAD